MIRLLSILWWKLKGWKLNGRFPDEEKKLVMAVGPHTSGWDVVVGLAARHAMKMKHGYFLGKKELFDGAFGWLFRSLGGTPVDRFSSQGMVEQVAAKFQQQEVFRLALSPEGTRQKVEKIRTGFYHIAKTAKVPILLIGFDFSKREVIIGPVIHPSDNEQEDFKKIIAFFAPIRGRFPEKDMEHLQKIYQ
jgi:1-acyl-sn-glycerol-3-phosphate acyltransferase